MLAAKMVSRRGFGFNWPCPRKLREVVKMSAFDKETAETCTMIWDEFHHAKNTTVSAVVIAVVLVRMINVLLEMTSCVRSVPPSGEHRIQESGNLWHGRRPNASWGLISWTC